MVPFEQRSLARQLLAECEVVARHLNERKVAGCPVRLRPVRLRGVSVVVNLEASPRADAEQVAITGENFVKALRRLKRDLNACRSCPLAEDCPVLSSFNSQVVAAITEVNIEWGML